MSAVPLTRRGGKAGAAATGGTPARVVVRNSVVILEDDLTEVVYRSNQREETNYHLE